MPLTRVRPALLEVEGEPLIARIACFAYWSVVPLAAIWALGGLLAGRIRSRDAVPTVIFFLGLMAYSVALGRAARLVRPRNPRSRAFVPIFIPTILHALVGVASSGYAALLSIRGSKPIDSSLMEWACFAVLLGWVPPLALAGVAHGAYRLSVIGFAGIAWLLATIGIAGLFSNV